MINYQLSNINDRLTINNLKAMKKDNPLKDKSYAFAVRIVKMYKYLCDKKHEYVLSKQVLRSGTSIGANNCRGEWCYF